MPFQTRHTRSLVLSKMGFGWNTWDEQPQVNDTGWDTAKIVMAKNFGSTVSGFQVASQFSIGQQITGQQLWITGIRPQLMSAAIWQCELSCKGILDNRPLKISGRSAVEQQEGKDVNVPLYGLAKRVQALEASPTVCIEYISTTSPQTQFVGLAGTPAYTAAVRASVWTSVADPLVHFPYGWVLLDMDYDKLTGVNVWLIKETWQYIFRFSP